MIAIPLGSEICPSVRGVFLRVAMIVPDDCFDGEIGRKLGFMYVFSPQGNNLRNNVSYWF
jgi:hypothetical protein